MHQTISKGYEISYECKSCKTIFWKFLMNPTLFSGFFINYNLSAISGNSKLIMKIKRLLVKTKKLYEFTRNIIIMKDIYSEIF